MEPLSDKEILPDKTAKVTGNDKTGYRAYLRLLFRSMLEREPGFYLNLSRESLILRGIVFFLMLCVVFFGLLIFRYYPLGNNVLANTFFYASIMTFLLAGFFLGPGIAAIPLILSLISVFFSAVCANFILIRLPMLPLAEITLATYLPAVSVLFAEYRQIIVQGMFLERLDYYESGKNYYAINLELEEYAPIKYFNRLIELDFSALKSVPAGYAVFITGIIKLTKKYRCILAGYTGESDSKDFKIYVYSGSDKLRTEAFIKKIYSLAATSHMSLNRSLESSDAEWSFYFNSLFPNKKQYCDIISRQNMEELYSMGVDFDCEYKVVFELEAKNEADALAIGKALSHYGFKTRQDCFEPTPDGCYAEYEIISYVTTRRINYLNELITSICDKYCANYEGEWGIDI